MLRFFHAGVVRRSVLALALLPGLGAIVPADAATTPRTPNDGARAALAAPALLGGASADRARLAAFVVPDFRVDHVVRSKGVAAVTHPAIGKYCIKPSFNTKPHTLVPVVAVEWGRSAGNGNVVQYHELNSICPADQIEVFTFHLVPATGFVFDDTTAFTIVVP